MPFASICASGICWSGDIWQTSSPNPQAHSFQPLQSDPTISPLNASARQERELHSSLALQGTKSNAIISGCGTNKQRREIWSAFVFSVASSWRSRCILGDLFCRGQIQIEPGKCTAFLFPSGLHLSRWWALLSEVFSGDRPEGKSLNMTCIQVKSTRTSVKKRPSQLGFWDVLGAWPLWAPQQMLVPLPHLFPGSW